MCTALLISCILCGVEVVQPTLLSAGVFEFFHLFPLLFPFGLKVQRRTHRVLFFIVSSFSFGSRIVVSSSCVEDAKVEKIGYCFKSFLFLFALKMERKNFHCFLQRLILFLAAMKRYTETAVCSTFRDMDFHASIDTSGDSKFK